MKFDVSHDKNKQLKQVNVFNNNFCVAVKEKIDSDGNKDIIIEFWLRDGEMIDKLELLEEDYY